MITLDGTTGITTPTTDSTAEHIISVTGFKNRIINGGMVIDQRNAGAATANTISGYTVDRFTALQSTYGKIIAQQNQGSITPPVGFSNYLGVTSQSAYSVLTGDMYSIQQLVEGFNISDLAWGTANAQTVTLSFWVRSSLTGTFGGSLTNTGAITYAFTYSIPVANTWTQISITVAGATTSTWSSTNTVGLYVRFGLGGGVTGTTSTLNSWISGNFTSVTGAVSVVGTSGATFYITGVQLEKGSVATRFDCRPYGTELSLCQRYYWRIYAGTGNQRYSLAQMTSTTQATAFIQFPVIMRTAPSALEQTGTASDYLLAYAATAQACSIAPTHAAASTNAATLTFTVASGLTVGQAAQTAANSANSYLGWSAEL